MKYVLWDVWTAGENNRLCCGMLVGTVRDWQAHNTKETSMPPVATDPSMVIVDAIEDNKQISPEQLVQSIAAELECSIVGGVLVDQVAIVNGSEVTLKFDNGQTFKLWAVPA